MILYNEKIIKQKANHILELTKKEKEKYENERKLIFSIMENVTSENEIIVLDKLINMFAKIIDLENEKQKYNLLIFELQKISKEHIRKEDNSNFENRANLFLIKDISGKKYTFFLREHAEKYIENNKNIFDNETNITIIKNDNIDLEILIDKIRDI